MMNTAAAFFRTVVWLNLLCAMTLPGVVVSAHQGVDEGASLRLSMQLLPASPRPDMAPTPNGFATCTAHFKSRLEQRH